MAGKTWEAVKAENIVRHCSGTYYLQAKVGGKKIRRSLKTADLRMAKIKRDAELDQLRALVPGSELRTLGQALARVEARELGKAHLRPKTRIYYEDLFRILRETLPLVRSAAAFAAAEAAEWWRETSAKRSAIQSNNLLRMLRHACAEAIRAGVRRDDPCEGLKRRRPVHSGSVPLPGREEFQRVVASIRSQRKAHSGAQAALVEFLAWSGCRIGEARAVRWEDVEGQWLRITGGENGTKNGEARRLPINPRLRVVLDRLRTEDVGDRIFHLKSPAAALRAACRREGVRHLRVHDLRHLFATQAIESGVDIPTVARWMGHKDGGALALRTYGHLRDDHSLASARKMG